MDILLAALGLFIILATLAGAYVELLRDDTRPDAVWRGGSTWPTRLA